MSDATRAVFWVPVEHAPALSAVLGAIGYPQDMTQARKVCALDPATTPATPPTHFLANDRQMDAGVLAAIRNMREGGTIPSVDWEAETDFTLAEVIEAMGQMHLFTETGDPANHADVETLLPGWGLQFVPTPLDP
jgi:hypothetical protein